MPSKTTYNFDFSLNHQTFPTTNFKLVVCIYGKLSVEFNSKWYSPNDLFYTISLTRVSQKPETKALGGCSTIIFGDLNTDPNHLSHLTSLYCPPTAHSSTHSSGYSEVSLKYIWTFIRLFFCSSCSLHQECPSFSFFSIQKLPYVIKTQLKHLIFC